MTTGPVVGAWHGVDTDVAALDWAADEAFRRCVPLIVVDAVDPGPAFGPDATGPSAEEGVLRPGASVSWLPRRHDLSARLEFCHTEPVPYLLGHSDRAGLIVLGRGTGDGPGDTRLERQIAAFARCPVLVVPTRPRERPATDAALIVVGLARAAESGYALEAAFMRAQLMRGRVLAVHATDSEAGPLQFDAMVAEWSAEFPSVPVELRVVAASPVDALLRASSDADVLVLGGRYSSGDGMSRVGPTSAVLLERAPCPVELVGWPHASRAPRGDSGTVRSAAIPPRPRMPAERPGAMDVPVATARRAYRDPVGRRP